MKLTYKIKVDMISQHQSSPRENEIQPGYARMQRTNIKGERKKYKITFNPTSIDDGQMLHIKIPRLDAMLSIIPGSLALSFEFKNKNTKSRFNNNLAACLIQKLQIRFGSEMVYDNVRENTLRLFKDKWWSSGFLSSRIESGIASLELRKTFSGDDSATNGAKTNEVLDTVMEQAYRRLRIPLGDILNDHGVIAPFSLGYDIEYILHFAPATDIMTAQSSQTVAGYTLDNLQLEYDTIRNETIASNALDAYSNRILSLEDVKWEDTKFIPKGELLTNINLHMTKMSLKSIIILFKYVDQIEDEEFIYPNIDKVECTIDGKPNSVFSQGLDVSDMHQEAREYFFHEDKLNAAGFLKDRFVVVLDFRSVRAHTFFNSGTTVDRSYGIQIRLHRRATAKDVNAIVYSVSEKALEMSRNGVVKVHL